MFTGYTAGLAQDGEPTACKSWLKYRKRVGSKRRPDREVLSVRSSESEPKTPSPILQNCCSALACWVSCAPAVAKVCLRLTCQLVAGRRHPSLTIITARALDLDNSTLANLQLIYCIILAKRRRERRSTWGRWPSFRHSRAVFHSEPAHQASTRGFAALCARALRSRWRQEYSGEPRYFHVVSC